MRTDTHLSKDRWLVELVSPRGKRYVRRKRVSARLSAQFPNELREIWVTKGTIGLVKTVKDRRGLSLSDAWDAVKRMVND